MHNKFGNDCNFNTFGNGCGKFTLDDITYNGNDFKDGCKNNLFGDYCGGNNFNTNCINNTFGNECFKNTFGNNCESNTFGNNCNDNIFGLTYESPKSYYRNIIFDSGNCYIKLFCTKSTGSGSYYQNVRIGLGVNNTTTYKTISSNDVNQSCETIYKPADSKTISI
jgi:hypothetical protein